MRFITRFFLYAVAMCPTHPAPAQGGSNACPAHQICHSITAPLSVNQRNLIRFNWDDFPGYDLNESFPAKYLSQDLFTFDIKVDGMGCVLPAFFSDTSFREQYLNRQLDDRNILKCTIFALLRNHKVIRDAFVASLQGRDRQFYLQKVDCFLNGKKILAENYFSFRDAWNQLFLSRILAQLNNQTREHTISNYVMFVGGYNVPYALMHIQANSLFAQVAARMNNQEQVQHTAFIRWIWPSFYFKHCDLEDEQCNIDNMRSAHVGFVSAFRVNNRAYFSGLTMRKFLNSIDSNVRVGMVTHSLGSTIVAAALMNPFSKMGNLSSPVNKAFVQYFTGEIIPGNRLTIFMNAPSMPGLSTFSYIDGSRARQQQYFIGINEKDEMLQKKLFKAFLLSGIRFPAYLSSTTLGCNRKSFWTGKREVQRTKEVIPPSLLPNFTFLETGRQETHDIFCYMNQAAFMSTLTAFVTCHINGIN